MGRKPVEVSTDLSFDDALRQVLHAPKPSEREPDVPQRKKKVVYKGETCEAVVLSFRPEQENWNEYLLDDGTLLKLKVVLTGVSRVDDKYDDQGNPVYSFDHALLPVVDAPEELRKEPKND